MSRAYEELVENNRPEDIGGVGQWYWIKKDKGAWDGPLSDWKNSHADWYFRKLPAKRVVICAGANCGLYSRLFSNEFETVYGFEPDPLNFHCFVNNGQKDNIIKIQAGLSDRHGTASVKRISDENVGMHKLEDTTDSTIPLLMIDDFEFRHLDLIQLDIEGHEVQALRGGIKTIKTHIPNIILENGQGPEIRDILEGLGYGVLGTSKSDTIWVPQGRLS